MTFNARMHVVNAIIFAKTVAGTLASPIDTIRQNRMNGSKLTAQKVVKAGATASLSSFVLSATCHKMAQYCEDVEGMRPDIAIVAGVISVACVKPPMLMLHKGVQTGLRTRMSWSKIMGISLVEDVVEESIKYGMSLSKEKRNSFTDSAVLCAVTYPFDLMKNTFIYSRKMLPKLSDIAIKVGYKMTSNVLYFKTFNAFRDTC